MLCDAENGKNGCLWEYPLLARLEEAAVAEDGSIVFEPAQEFRERDTRDRQHVFLTGKGGSIPPPANYLPKRELDGSSLRVAQLQARMLQ